MDEGLSSYWLLLTKEFFLNLDRRYYDIDNDEEALKLMTASNARMGTDSDICEKPVTQLIKATFRDSNSIPLHLPPVFFTATSANRGTISANSLVKGKKGFQFIGAC